MRISKMLTEKVDVDFVIEIMQQNETSKHFELREFLFLEDILPNISHKINKLGCNKNSLGETFFFGGREGEGTSPHPQEVKGDVFSNYLASLYWRMCFKYFLFWENCMTIGVVIKRRTDEFSKE